MNKTESKAELIARLTEEADTGTVATVAMSGREERVSLITALEFRRDQYGLTKAEFARILGMHRSNYSDFTSGGRCGFPLSARKRAYAIGVPANVLLQKGDSHE